jgi:hypothetical protein
MCTISFARRVKYLLPIVCLCASASMLGQGLAESGATKLAFYTRTAR